MNSLNEEKKTLVFNETTIISIRGYARQHQRIDDILKEAIDKSALPEPDKIEKTTLYVPVELHDLEDGNTAGRLVSDFDDEKVYIIRQWNLFYSTIEDHIYSDLPAGTSSVLLQASAVVEGIPV